MALKDQIKVTSKNRGAAKRLLSTWHPSTAVRTWTVSELTTRLWQAINEGLITAEGAHRALHKDDYNPQGGGDYEEPGEGKGGEDDEKGGEGPQGGQGEGQGQEPGEEKDAEQTAMEAVARKLGKQDAENGEEKDAQKFPGDEALQEAYEQGYDEASKDDDGEEQDGEQEEQQQDEEQDEERPQPQDHPKLKDVIRYVQAGLNVALVGPAGSGKSYMARQVADATGREFFVNGAMLSKYDLIGYKDANGVYHSTPAYDAFVTGGLHCFDELDASAPDAVVAFNGMTDDQPFFTFPDGQHPKHENYRAIACMNTWGNGADAEYVGRYKQDAAAMNRFVRVFIGYNESVERALADKDICERAWQVRKACDTLGIKHVVSTRTIKLMQKARDGGVARRSLDADILFAGLNEDTIKQIKANMGA